MKVLLIDVNCKNSSTGKIVYDLYTRLNERGDNAAICYGRGKKIKEKNIFKFGLDFETYLHALLTRFTGYTGCFSYFSTRRLIRFIKKFKPDVVHIHELHAYFINIKQLLNYLKKSNIKVVHTLHCTFSYTGKCGHHYECEKWKECCGKCPRLKEYVSTMFFDHTKKMFLDKKKAFTGFNDMSISCPSNWLANLAKQSFLGQYPIKVIPNGINTDVFHFRKNSNIRNELNIKNGEKLVLAVAPNIMSSLKGGEWIIKLASKMNGFKFLIIGADNRVSNPPSNVIVLPRIYDQDLLANCYSIADLFLICSEKENFPTTCLEAQCCGLLVCGFDAGGTKETSIFNENMFVDYGNLDLLENAVMEMLSKKTDKELLSAKAVFMYSNKAMFEKYYELYKNTPR